MNGRFQKQIRHREPPLGGVAIQGRRHRAEALDCFVAKRLLAMTVWGGGT
jgi:hypothetical protein